MDASQSWDWPPPDIAVAELFERWLPGRLRGHRAARARRDAGRCGSASRARAAAPGIWRSTAAAARHAARGASRPTSGSGSSVADLRVALGAPDPDLPALRAGRLVGAPPSVRRSGATSIWCKQISGRMLLEIEGRRRRRWALDVGFGKAGVSAGRPRTTVRLDGPTFEGLRSGAIPPMQPLLDGRLKIEGDRALAMQLLLLVGSRLGRR